MVTSPGRRGEGCSCLLSATERIPYLFTGKEFDQETGLYDFGARMYDPRVGLWASPDPALPEIVAGGGNESFSIIEPRSLNLTAYSLQNPVRMVDPDGREPSVWDHIWNAGVREVQRRVDNAVGTIDGFFATSRDGAPYGNEQSYQEGRVQGAVIGYVADAIVVAGGLVGGGGGAAATSTGVLAPVGIPIAAEGVVLVGTGVAGAVVHTGVIADAVAIQINQMSSDRNRGGGRGGKLGRQRDGTPGNNQVQNRQVTDAIRRAERETGSRLTQEQRDALREQLHEEISRQNLSFHEIVDAAKDLLVR